MKRIKIAYLVSTWVFSLVMLAIALAYLFSAQMKASFSHLGFPDYFRIELAVAKLVGIIGLLHPTVKGRMKEWLYAGFVITLCSGFIAHCAAGETAVSVILPLIMLAILIASYRNYRRLNVRRKSRGIVYLSGNAA